MKKLSWSLVLGLATFFYPLSAQQDTTLTNYLDSVVITATRLSTSYESSTYSQTPIKLGNRTASLQLRSLSEQLDMTPGIFTSNDHNYAQDLRITMRGFGARSAFGIRGIKLLVDGVPETTPDGQGQLDNLMLSNIDRIEVLHGPNASLYGNASGGVIALRSTDPFEAPKLQGSIRRGSYGYSAYTLQGAIRNEQSALSASFMQQSAEGFRNHSASSQLNVALQGSHIFSAKSNLRLFVQYTDSPEGQDPGGVNLATVESARNAARDVNVRLNAGEAIQHWKSSFVYNHEFSNSLSLETYGFLSGRDFIGRLPFEFGGWVNLERTYGGLGVRLIGRSNLKNGINKWSAGIDYADQNDNRDRYRNLEEGRGVQTLSQLESFGSIGFYFMDQLSLGDWVLRAAIRYDQNKLSITDAFLQNGDDSGARDLSSFNPSIGVNYKIAPKQFIYASFATSYETPTLSELSSNPNGGGFNDDLLPQRASNIELGIRGRLGDKFQYDWTFYKIKTLDEAIPYELEAFPGRTFYRNAGSTSRWGVEGIVDYKLSTAFGLQGSYTYGSIQFDDYVVDGTDLSSNKLPGVPEQQFSLAAVYDNEGYFARAHLSHVGILYANDANSVEIDARTLLGFSASKKISFGDFYLEPSISINNILGTEYFDNIRLNAFGSRYYEAAPGRLMMVGLTFSWK